MGLRHVFGFKPIPTVLDHFIVFRFADYPLSELAKETGVSYRTLQTILPSLVETGLIKETRTVSNAKFYAANFESPSMQKLDAFTLEADSYSFQKFHEQEVRREALRAAKKARAPILRHARHVQLAPVRALAAKRAKRAKR